jgi:PAS domain S-box-containing protein
MHELLGPAIALMNRLRYPQKFLLISMLFLAPLALVLVLLIVEVNAKADFAQKELYGDTYLRTVRKLFEHTLQEQSVAHAYLNGDTKLRPNLTSIQAQIDDDFSALSAIDRELGSRLQTTEKYNALSANWQQLKGALPALQTGNSDDLHASFIANIRGLISLVGDTSNLILDPDLDSYYTMDSVLLKLPENQDLLARTLTLGERIIAQKNFSADEKAQLTILSGLLRSNQNAIAQGLDVAARNNPAGNLRPALKAPLQEFVAAHEALLERINREMIYAPALTAEPEVYQSSITRAHAASFGLWDRAVDTLDDLLQARIAGSNQKKNLVVVVTVLVLALVLYLWVAFYVAVKRTVARLDLASRRMLHGDMAEAIQLDSRDELADVARSFNTIASALISSSAYQRAVLDNAVDGIITIAEDGRVDSVNPAAERIFGYAADEMIGQDIKLLIPPPHNLQYQAVGVGREVAARRKDGSQFPLDLAIGEMRLGEQHHYIGIAHDLTERKRDAEERARLQEQIIQAQAATLAELSTPLIPISDDVLVMPLVGGIDSQRAQQVIETLLHGIEERSARVALLDITGVPMVDTQVAQALLQAAQSVRLLGARVVLTGIRPEVAQMLVGLGVNMREIETHSTLQSGIAFTTQTGKASSSRRRIEEY